VKVLLERKRGVEKQEGEKRPSFARIERLKPVPPWTSQEAYPTKVAVGGGEGVEEQEGGESELRSD